MFSNLKNMVKENNLASVIFILDNGDITLRREWSDYKVLFEVNEGFEEHKVSEVQFFQYLENAMKKFSYSGEFKIVNTVKTPTICSFRIENI